MLLTNHVLFWRKYKNGQEPITMLVQGQNELQNLRLNNLPV